MRFGIREICDVVLKAKANQKVGNKIFYKNEPVIYFDTLKTSSLEGAATTVYAQGGRGNARLMAWEGERSVTFTMEDALISPAGLMILTGAGLIEASKEHSIKVHTTEQTDKVELSDSGDVEITLSQKPYYEGGEDFIYVMLVDGDEPISEPFIPSGAPAEVKNESDEVVGWKIVLKPTWTDTERLDQLAQSRGNDLTIFSNTKSPVVLVDFYVERTGGVSEITITPDKFGGYYYLEASTLFRNTDGVDMPAEFVIPSCKIQSNFNFSMASTGDPSTFTFTIDAFPDYTRFDRTKKVLAALQIITEAEGSQELTRVVTHSEDYEDRNGMIDGVRPYSPSQAAND